jgi:hypothetical protein
MTITVAVAGCIVVIDRRLARLFSVRNVTIRKKRKLLECVALKILHV